MNRLYRCKTPEEFKKSGHYRRTIEDDRREEAEERTWLCHYTNVEALYKILANRTIRFSRIDQVNDLSEKDLLNFDQLYLGTYIACFNHNYRESIPLWKMYTTRGMGVRIEYEFKEKGIQQYFVGIDEKKLYAHGHYANVKFCDFVSSIHDVEYSEDIKVNPIFCDNDTLFIDPQAFAFEKSSYWQHEDETRVTMLTFKEHQLEMPPYIDFLVDFTKIKSITIRYDPWMSSEVKKSVELTANHYMMEMADLVNCKDSELEGKIR